MPLREELESVKATFAQKNDPSVVAAYERGIEALRAEGIERNALKPGDLAEWNGGDRTLPVPGTFVIGKDRRVTLTHVDADYRARLEPADAIAAARRSVG